MEGVTTPKKKNWWVGGRENFVILQVGDKVRPPHHVIVYGENSVGGWSKKKWSDKNCDSVGRWSEMSSVVIPHH